MLRAVAIGLGMLAEAFGWWLIVRGRGSVWRTLIPIYCGEAIIALALRSADLSGRFQVSVAVAVGLVSGLVLYAATLAFVAVATRWSKFGEDVAWDYSQTEEVSAGSAILLSAAIAAPAEEIFWRGLVVGTLREHASIATAGVIAWLGYVVVKSCSRSLPLLAGAVVGGALWTWLAGRSAGVLAPISSHAVWTGLMVGFPPKPRSSS